MVIRWLTVVLDFPAASFATGVEFWREVTGSGLSPFRGTSGEFATLLPPEGDACLRVQRVEADGGGCHLDLHAGPGTSALAEASAHATALGAVIHHHGDDLAVLASPGGFPLCIVPWEGETAVPAPVLLGCGGASRADQLCLDIPPQSFGAECAFWAALTGWDLRPGGRPEFAYLARPAGIPARLLLQRRDDAGPGERVTGHPDFACADRRSLAERHTAAGARIRSVFPFWITMTDPTGHPYCLTGRDPRAGTLPSTSTA